MAGIDHLVVLMPENRSFDSMLGRLHPAGPAVNGPKGDEYNIDDGEEFEVWSSGESGPPSDTVPTPDPGASFDGITARIVGAGKAPPSPPTMEGFAENYATIAGAKPKDIMHVHAPGQVSVLSALARSFGVSDEWFASAPNQTWPNRFFVHTGTADGYVNDKPLHVPYMTDLCTCPT